MDSLFEFTETIEAEVERTMVEEGQAARKGEVASRERERERVVGTFCTPAFPSAINWPRRVLLSAENASKASDDASLTFSPPRP